MTAKLVVVAWVTKSVVKSKVVVALRAELKALSKPVPEREVLTVKVSMLLEVALSEAARRSVVSTSPVKV